MRGFSHIGMMAAVLLCLPQCAFIESAFELTFGEGDIPALEESFLWPNVEELTG